MSQPPTPINISISEKWARIKRPESHIWSYVTVFLVVILFPPKVRRFGWGDLAMQIICPTCNASYKIKSNQIPKKRAVAKCKKCNGSIVVGPEQKSEKTPALRISDVGKPPRAPVTKPGRAVSMAVLEAYPSLRGIDTNRFALEALQE
jgi:predicted Zn finger-like uncharacterized protein